jgi:hypothetical protein
MIEFADGSGGRDRERAREREDDGARWSTCALQRFLFCFERGLGSCVMVQLTLFACVLSQIKSPSQIKSSVA